MAPRRPRGLWSPVLEELGSSILEFVERAQFLDGLNPGEKLRAEEVKGGTKIDLGGGHVLEFVMAPNLHWPGERNDAWPHARGEQAPRRGDPCSACAAPAPMTRRAMEEGAGP